MSEKPKQTPEPTKKTAPEQPKAQQATPPADIYTAAELVANSRTLFQLNPDIAAAALEHAGITETTIDKAKAVVKAFAERKV